MNNKLYVDKDETAYAEKIDQVVSYKANNTNSLKQFSSALDTCVQLTGAFEAQDKALGRAIERHASTHRKNYEDYYSEDRLFCNIKKTMESDILFPVLKRMPKGSLFHVHGAAGLSFDRLMELCVSWNKDSVGADWKIIQVVLDTIPDRIDKYTLMYQYQIDLARKKGEGLIFKELGEFLAVPGNRGELKESICMLDGGIATKDIWTKFNHSYARFNSLFRNKEFYKRYFEAFFGECINDQIASVDIRLGLEEFDEGTQAALLNSAEHYLRYGEGFTLDRYLYFKDQAANLPRVGNVNEKHLEFLEQIADALTATKYSAKVILTANRNTNIADPVSMDKLERKVDLAIAVKMGELPDTISFKAKLANLVVGFDFVNQEDRGYSTDAYKSVIYGDYQGKPRIQCIDFYLHDGESCWKLAPNMKELKSASIIEASVVSKYRIGHGLTMAQYPELIAAIQNGASNSEPMLPPAPFLMLPILEINPISNQLLKYCSDLRLHPMPQLMKSGINCVLSNDDPLILDNPGLTYDFWISIMDMELTYEMVKKLVFVTYAFTEIRNDTSGRTENELLSAAQGKFEKAWKGFLRLEVVQKFIKAYARNASQELD